MQNPFESGHIKNYLLLYASVVVIMILFFIASTLFHDVKDVDKKVFDTKPKGEENIQKSEPIKREEQMQQSRFKLLDKSY